MVSRQLSSCLAYELARALVRITLNKVEASPNSGTYILAQRGGRLRMLVVVDEYCDYGMVSLKI